MVVKVHRPIKREWDMKIHPYIDGRDLFYHTFFKHLTDDQRADMYVEEDGRQKLGMLSFATLVRLPLSCPSDLPSSFCFQCLIAVEQGLLALYHPGGSPDRPHSNMTMGQG
jgi:hypothetical protein